MYSPNRKTPKAKQTPKTWAQVVKKGIAAKGLPVAAKKKKVKTYGKTKKLKVPVKARFTVSTNCLNLKFSKKFDNIV